ncbi:Rpn family recombination-promoting nuclease/putative transposase [Candidatus Epulonipiscium viviparus]|uniref:Rpn family recombination-promoting nuclease/putative transposase n=1 Tax=Candidatus Epulonipiscium viviparus TaxID=420336 RepID=UPI0027380FEA|nr:Rpn family recombination-promoting nuclease/putative transposase [Candidatus Epulopiscium viviparus]
MNKENHLIRFDWAIKTVLRNKSNFDILGAFISDLTNLDVQVEEILESESNQDSASDKFNRVDILVKDTQENRYIIEIQNNEEKYYLKRMLYGISKNIVENIRIGEKYDSIVKVISINIVYFELGLGYDDVYLGKTTFTGLKTNTQLNESNKNFIATYSPNTNYDPSIFPEYYIILPNRFDDEVKTKFDEWLYLLKNSKVDKSTKSKIMKRVDEALNILKMTDNERKIYERQIQNNVIYETQIDTARENGRQDGLIEGFEKGKAIGQVEVYSEMGFSAIDIATKLNLSITEVQEIIDIYMKKRG